MKSPRTWLRSEVRLSGNPARARFPSNRHFFAAIRDLRRAPVEPDVDIDPLGEHELSVHLTAPAYAYFVHFETSDETLRLSDNYFDLEPGEERNIAVTNVERPLTPEMIKVRWH